MADSDALGGRDPVNLSTASRIVFGNVPISMLAGPTLQERASWILKAEGTPPTLEVPITAKTAYLTHGLFRYVGKLPPPLVAYLLEHYSDESAVVVDPMCGGGSTAIEAVSSGRSTHSFDINPVSRLVTSAVSTPTDVAALLAFAEHVAETFVPRKPTGELKDFFCELTYGLLRTGLDLADNPAQSALMLSIARPASFANTKKINTVVDPTKTPKSATVLLAAAARRFCDGLDELAATNPAASVVGEAAATAIPMEDASADFVLLHPPYLTNTAFSESMHLQLLLLGLDPKDLRKLELAYRGSYFHVPNGLHKYLIGWARILAEAKRLLRPGGRIAVVVGDGRIDRVRVPVGTITEEYGADLGLRLVERAVHKLNNQTGWTLSRRMTGQHVLVFEAQ